MKLDDAYANMPYIPDAEGYLERWAIEAATFRKMVQADGRAELGVSYGSSERQRYDLFLPKNCAEGTIIFVHGGYWLKFHRTYWSHLAAGALARGWAVAMPSYDLCPHVRIADITRQIAQAVEIVADRIDGPIRLAGHSAGGHLVARMCVPGVLRDPVAAQIERVLSISPVSDLRPLLQTSMNTDFRMDMAEARAESPVLMRPIDLPVTIWVGADERPVFLDQARWLVEAWDCTHVVEPGRHHFNVIEALVQPDSPMIKALLD